LGAASDQLPQDVAVLEVGLYEVQELLRNLCVLRNAQANARLAARQRITVIAARADIGRGCRHGRRLAGTPAGHRLEFVDSLSGSRSRPVSFTKSSRSPPESLSPMAAISSVRHANQLSPARTWPSKLRSAKASRSETVGFTARPPAAWPCGQGTQQRSAATR